MLSFFPRRQAVLVAKQAAYLDVVSKGRLTLGVGTGWNSVEYEALGVPFEERGRIFDDQIGVLRSLWTEKAVTLASSYHTVTDAGINPLPIQRPIPIWFGGGGKHPVFGTPNVEKVLRRMARLADGWMPTFGPDAEGSEIVERLRGFRPRVRPRSRQNRPAWFSYRLASHRRHVARSGEGMAQARCHSSQHQYDAGWAPRF